MPSNTNSYILSDARASLCKQELMVISDVHTRPGLGSLLNDVLGRCS